MCIVIEMHLALLTLDKIIDHRDYLLMLVVSPVTLGPR